MTFSLIVLLAEIVKNAAVVDMFLSEGVHHGIALVCDSCDHAAKNVPTHMFAEISKQAPPYLRTYPSDLCCSLQSHHDVQLPQIQSQRSKLSLSQTQHQTII